MSKKISEILDGQQFIALTTYRKNGLGVMTPVWFALDGEKFYVWTEGSSGKVKRIRNNARVQVTPSDARGQAQGESFSAQARILDPDKWAAADALYKKKYGFQLTMFRTVMRMRGGKHVFLEITPEAA